MLSYSCLHLGMINSISRSGVLCPVVGSPVQERYGANWLVKVFL